MDTTTRPVVASQRDKGFTLVEILVAIVVVGILAAVAIIGITSLTKKGNSSACNSTLDAAKAASVVHYANDGSKYPQTFNDLVGGTPPELQMPDGATYDVTDKIATVGDWKLTLTPGATTGDPTSFSCS